MNILYLGKYKKRFNRVIQCISSYPRGVRVLELCFGDIYIAKFCKTAGFIWTGFDLNTTFVRMAKSMAFDAHEIDLIKVGRLPPADVCVMMGSFYHFHSEAQHLLSKMFAAAQTVILSEPVSNLSTRGGIIGWLGKRSANAGRGTEHFRYNRDSFLNMLQETSKVTGFTIEILQAQGKDMIVKLNKNNGNS